MKHKVAELEGALLDAAVAMAEGLDADLVRGGYAPSRRWHDGGPIIERELEHLAPSDIMINRVRRRLLGAVNQYLLDGKAPANVDQPSLYARVRGGQFVASETEDWLRAYDREIEASPWESLAEQAAE